ncbi:unnamed protein product [Staurois parvus]|uniref:Uncharacterized protein n=1 Tax=Staurois parvus TaxID=386267 RepID=A0ABN9FDW8_9NEOB|nr:unnamed protein product [Staurois parvus]
MTAPSGLFKRATAGSKLPYGLILLPVIPDSDLFPVAEHSLLLTIVDHHLP